ncbi:MAG: saccharopine dehydrogenase NADP-binding domain-containing protein [Bacteroidales bacterium]|nr:saccharopine dehydrogenase NADP-binding domain-containing protein [Bacteroidales bacterium]
MKNILLIGAGLSSSTLIKYLLDNAKDNKWQLIVGDQSLELAQKKIEKHPFGRAIKFDAFNIEQRESEIKNADIVISMLPARLHYLIAEVCLQYNKNMVTASYVSDQIKEMDADLKAKKLLFLNEIGVDPGIDHMSAMKIIDDINNKGGKIEVFESNTGGLVAPEFDNNPWNYKFTWNPRNVVIAGQSGARFLDRAQIKYIPYNQLFRRTELLPVLDYGEFESIPNRDSLQYIDVYGLDNINTMYRGTFRRPGFASGWHVLIQLGLTDDSFKIKKSEELTYRNFINAFLPYGKDRTVEEKTCDYLNIGIGSETMQKLRWLGIFENKQIGLKNASPAQILQKLLEEKWRLSDEDLDMIVMQHQFIYTLKNKRRKIISSMIVKGDNQIHTAMSKTVGLPLAIAVKYILNGVITEIGVKLPVCKNIYQPILAELENYGIAFTEEEFELD